MAFAVAFGIIGIGIFIALAFTNGKSKKRKFIVWGITTMLAIAPFLSWIISILYGIYEKEGFAAIGLMMILFPLFFLVGIILLLIGIFGEYENIL
ncbi:hypothetical protein [Sutcliffiella halmapala]|uniref:hypothetical protein n=1 Tax=Sutcliffiella halmapala TaxID=79882 RepID=UPI000995CF43|nr:hypothetical protein [Sutcliffiella halmapala]